MIKLPETQQEVKQYDLVIVGGGCSSLAFLVNALRNNKIDEIAGQNGICILERSNNFGGGTLEENLIPSNTHSVGLLRFIMGEMEAYMLPSEYEKYLKGDGDVHDQSKVDSGVLECFKEIMSTQVYQDLKKRGSQTGSLQEFGYFLRLVGNSFLTYAQKKQLPITFVPYCECQEFYDKSYGIENKDKYGDFYKVQYKNTQNNDNQIVMGKNILMATGGKQSLHSMYEFVPSEKRFMCQDFLKQEGFLRALKLIEENPEAPISIIGGSHSGFSAAYMLLKGPDYYDVDDLRFQSEFSQNRQNLDQQLTNIEPMKINKKIKNYVSPIKQGQITVYHRSPLRVAYCSKKLAQEAGYTNWDEDCVHKIEGVVNAYTGLRGLTKEFYLDIAQGKENRVTIQQFNNVKEVKEDILKSSIVIECLGYKTNIIDYRNKDQVQEYTYDIDNFMKMDQQHRLHGMENVYGTGLGFGLQTEDELIQGEKFKDRKVRADSLQVYLSRLGSKVLQNMLIDNNKNTLTNNCDYNTTTIKKD